MAESNHPSPGHKKWPDHKVKELPIRQRMQVEINGEVIADSDTVIEVAEDDHPSRYYFSREDVRMDKLSRSETTTKCPFKGEARYYGLRDNGKSIDDLAWTYEEPFDEHAKLRDRIAFHNEKEGIAVRTL